MQVDCLIRGAEIVDGTGAPRRSGDVAILDGRIVGLGQVQAQARREIDAGGCWLTPGFVDPHTHLDAQLCW
ncbi:MAG: amidohydrolase family protein, partial [Myxococcota bacterium]